MVMMHLQDVVAVVRTVVRDMFNAAGFPGLAIADPTAIGQLMIAARNMRQNGGVGLDRRHAHT
ncbi:hypothetical protein ASTA108788_04820 [Asticcacaulis taihuensis]|uniref:Uncharacterized protein n=1 Tax=Asticcacaulis taihuensis TaxID=260084 RepID=A0A1G4PTK3_9CAUL|nr:hypothetical protein SAMN02927928_0655 [Asticcacaulis taihuensis]